MLLYDGEELVGAKQNRILNVTVLVGAGAKLPIPVSCVEQGRWARSSVDFDSATHISHAHLRRRKAEMLSAQPLARGVAQGEVWDEVGEKAARACAFPRPPAPPATSFVAHARPPRGARGRLPARSRASAVPCSRSATTSASTAVSRPDAFALLWPKLRAGYLLDALERLDGKPAAASKSPAFVDEVADAAVNRGALSRPRQRRSSARPGVIGSGLELDGERSS